MILISTRSEVELADAIGVSPHKAVPHAGCPDLEVSHLPKRPDLLRLGQRVPVRLRRPAPSARGSPTSLAGAEAEYEGRMAHFPMLQRRLEEPSHLDGDGVEGGAGIGDRSERDVWCGGGSIDFDEADRV